MYSSSPKECKLQAATEAAVAALTISCAVALGHIACSDGPAGASRAGVNMRRQCQGFKIFYGQAMAAAVAGQGGDPRKQNGCAGWE
jgi:hypothetical protein